MKAAALSILAVLALAACGTQLSVPKQVSPVVLPHTAEGELPTATSCGRERWNVKTLTDPDAGNVNLSPKTTTVDRLRTISPSPTAYGPDMARQPAEQTTYTVHATLTEARTEADGDYHLVLADPTDGKTLVAEIPDPSCATGSVGLSQITQARSEFVRMFGAPGGYPKPVETINKPVTVTGVAFYDAEHGQTGSAQIGGGEDIELHPVLAITSP